MIDCPIGGWIPQCARAAKRRGRSAPSYFAGTLNHTGSFVLQAPFSTARAGMRDTAGPGPLVSANGRACHLFGGTDPKACLACLESDDVPYYQDA